MSSSFQHPFKLTKPKVQVVVRETGSKVDCTDRLVHVGASLWRLQHEAVLTFNFGKGMVTVDHILGTNHIDVFVEGKKVLENVGGFEKGGIGRVGSFNWRPVQIASTLKPPVKKEVQRPVEVVSPPKPKPISPPSLAERKVAPSLSIFAQISENVIRREDEAPEDLVSIIILSYNTLEVTWKCVSSVLSNTIHPYELIVVDNNSKDGTVEWLRKQKYLTLIANNQNLGFSKANNKAIKQARGKYVLLLNSDVIARTKGWLKMMVKCAEKSPNVGTVGAKLLYPDGKIQHVGGGIHKTNPFHPYEKYPVNVRTFRTRRVPYNTGACLLITRTALEKVGLLDEEYPFGFEDVDYGLKVVEKGLWNVICPKAVLTHLWAYTQRKTGRGIKSSSIHIYHRKWDAKLPKLAKKVSLDWGPPRAA